MHKREFFDRTHVAKSKSLVPRIYLSRLGILRSYSMYSRNFLLVDGNNNFSHFVAQRTLEKAYKIGGDPIGGDPLTPILM